MVQTIIDNYPDTEFAIYAYIDIAYLHGKFGKNEKAIQSLNNMFAKYQKNFFLGNHDLFSLAYINFVRFYYKLLNFRTS